MKKLAALVLSFTIASFALGGSTEDGIRVSQEWQFALAGAVKQLVKEGQTDPKTIAKLATEKTQPEEKKVRAAGKAMGVSDKELDRSIKADRESSLKDYIDSFLPRKQQHP